MIEDMTVRNLSPATQRSYVHAVSKLSRYFGRSPDRRGLEDVCAFQVHLVSTGISWPVLNQIVCALRFFYGVTLGHGEIPERIPYAREPRKLPVVLSADEVVRFLEAVPSLKTRVALTTAYAAGLRASETVGLKIGDVDSGRMVIRVEAGRPHMRFVPVKSAEQLALQAIHRVRSRLVSARTRLVNQVRGLLAEHGFVIARDIAKLRRHLADVIGCSESTLNSLVRTLLIEMQEELTDTDRRIAIYDQRVRDLYRTSEPCRRLGKIEGIGPLSATALVAAVGDQTLLQERSPVCSLARAGAKAAVEWRPRPTVRHQQARRPLLAHVAHPWGSRRFSRGRQSKIREAGGSASCANGDIRMSRPSHLPTRMHGSCGPCSPATDAYESAD